MNKQELLRYVTDYYLNSGDFNGTPNYNMPPFEIADLVELIEEVYSAVKDLRMMFSKHPKAKMVEKPDELRDEENIVIY